MAAPSIRARVRAEMITEIKSTALRRMAQDGSNLSLRAVARDMGMVSSALYRYFASRDDLLTALIIDAYNAVADAAEAGDAEVADRADLAGRLHATCRAVRHWALDHAIEYALIFGSPVPGYAAPQDTIPAATRTPAVLVRILVEGHMAGLLPADGELPDVVRADMRRAIEQIAPGLPEIALARGMLAWVHLFGCVSFELFGQFNNVVEARDEFFDFQVAEVTKLVLGPANGSP